jgi:hypothetical protein
MISIILLGLMVWAFYEGFWGVGFILLLCVLWLTYQGYRLLQAKVMIDESVRELKEQIANDEARRV